MVSYIVIDIKLIADTRDEFAISLNDIYIFLSIISNSATKPVRSSPCISIFDNILPSNIPIIVEKTIMERFSINILFIILFFSPPII